VVPANREPHMMVEAPSPKALVMFPEFWMPPSAITGTPRALPTRETWYTALACPLPTAHTYGPCPTPEGSTYGMRGIA